MNKLPLNPKKEIFRWGPIPGRFFYTSFFTEVNYKYFCQKFLGLNWSRSLFLFRNRQMLWLNEYAALRSTGQKVFVKYWLPSKSRNNIYKRWKEEIVKLERWHRYLDNIDLAKLTDKQFNQFWADYSHDYINFWIYGTVPELANYGADKYIEKELSKYIKDKTNLKQVVQILTTPEKPSFYQEEEMALATSENLKKHQQKFYWLKNSYAGTQVLPLSFFVERKKEITSNIKLETRQRLAETRRNKVAVIKQYNLSKSIINIGQAISEGITVQDERKKYIFMALHYQDRLLVEVARRFDYSVDDLLNTWYWEIGEIIDGKDLRNILDNRRSGFGVNFYKNCKILDENETKSFWQLYGEEKIVSQTEVKGLVVSKGKGGKVIGHARILLDPNQVGEFKVGEILLAPMTSPEYIFAMKKALAIVTDFGGLTCHAAIVSRELGIPCIVNTKTATKIFKDGDKVEVDANNGLVRKV